MTKSRLAAVAVLALLLGACGSIPLGTMWKMYRMGPEGLLASNPGEVRAAVLSESWFLDGESFDSGRLEIEMTRADDSVESFSFGLAELSGLGPLQLEPAGPGQRWRVYAIEKHQLADFQAMQRQLFGWLESDEFEGGGMSVAVWFDGKSDDESPGGSEPAHGDDVEEEAPRHPVPVDDTRAYPDEVLFRVDLQLREDEGFFPLIREYSMPITSASDDE